MKKTELTDEKIALGLIELMQTTKLEHITMTQLSEHVKLSRITLYRHFDDKYEIIEAIEQKVMAELEQAVHNVYNTDLKQLLLARDEKLSELLAVFERQRLSITTLLSVNGDPSFHYKLQQFLERSEQKGQRLLNEPNRLFTIYQTNAVLGVIEYWLKTPEQSVDDIHAFLMVMTDKILN